MSARLLAFLQLITLGTAGLLSHTAFADQQPIAFTSDRWTMLDAEVVEHLGRSCLQGTAMLKDAAFDNGIIEFDIAVSGVRSFPGVTFRASSQLEYEEFYLRPHASGRPDATQYTPVFSGVSGWQLYNGKGFTAAAEIPTDEWIHVRLEILGKRARVFMHNNPVPVLTVTDLKHDVIKGPVGIKSRNDSSAYFSNFSVTNTDDLDLPATSPPVIPRGLITHWQLSQPFAAARVRRDTYPTQTLLQSIAWQPITAEPTGLVDVSRWIIRSSNGTPETVLARTELEAGEKRTVGLSFGYSDMVTVFLNGQPLFSGNSQFRSRSATYLGAVSLNDAVFLPLAKGTNELLLILTESLGGWGFIAQLDNADLLAPGVVRLWQLAAELDMPESVVFDMNRDMLYVSNYFRGGNEYISRLSTSGEIVDLEWISGLSRPTGMVVEHDRLWVVERSGLTEIDINTGMITNRYPVQEAGFPNDVARDAKGRLYVSDSAGGKIYRLEDGTFKIWLEGDTIAGVNGLSVDGGRLLFGTAADGCVKAAQLETRQLTTIACLGGDAIVDGLCPDGAGGFVVSDYNGRVFRLSASGETTPLLDLTSSGDKTADLVFIPSEHLLVVPGLFDNTLTAYRVLATQP